MVFLKTSTPPHSASNLGPRLSFSELLVGKNSMISISPDPKDESEPRTSSTGEFEFLSGGLTNMIAADELFCEGKLLPFWKMQQSNHYQLDKMTLDSDVNRLQEPEQVDRQPASRISWFLDDDPSPRPPTCAVLWKELLRLRKQRASSLSPSSSSSSSSSSSLRSSKTNETPSADGGKELGENKEKVAAKRMKRAVEGKKWASSIRIRPVFTLAVCSQRKNNVSPMFYPRKQT